MLGGCARAQTDIAHGNIHRPLQHGVMQIDKGQLNPRQHQEKEHREQDDRAHSHGAAILVAQEINPITAQAVHSRTHHWVNLSWRIDEAIEAKASLISSPFTS